MACCFSGSGNQDEFDGPVPPQFIHSSSQGPRAEELRSQLSTILPPVEVDLSSPATVNLSNLPSGRLPGRPSTPLGAFERRQSIRPEQRGELAAAAAAATAAVHGQQQEQPDARQPSGTLQWTDSRKLLEAAIAMEQLQPMASIPEGGAAPGQGWGWGGGELEAAEQRLQARLFKLKLELYVMDGDGNCQFRAISFGLWGSPKYHGWVRKQAVGYMRQRRPEFEAFLGEEFEGYTKQMARGGTWGDELTLRAACEALGVVVNVITSDAANWFLRYIPRSARPQHEIFVTYIAPLHYNAIRRLRTGERLRQSFGRQHSQLARAVSTYRRRYGIPETPQHVVQAAMMGG